MYFRNVETGEELTFSQLKKRLNLSFPYTSPPEGWVEHVYVAPEVVDTTLSSNEFFELFTEDEQRAIVNLTMTNVDIKIWYDRMWGSDFIDLADPRIELGLLVLMGYGLITEARMEEIRGPENFPPEGV